MDFMANTTSHVRTSEERETTARNLTNNDLAVLKAAYEIERSGTGRGILYKLDVEAASPSMGVNAKGGWKVDWRRARQHDNSFCKAKRTRL